MKESKCRYCGAQFTNRMQVGGHQTFCKLNPNYNVNRLKVKSTRSTNNPISNYTIICSKCGKQFTLQITKLVYESGKYRKHCSRSCANSRAWTEHDKLKKSLAAKTSDKVYLANRDNKLKLKQKYPMVAKTCPVCKAVFHSAKKTQIYCSIKCVGARWKSEQLRQLRQKQSIATKLAYKQGRKKVQGGTTQWIQMQTSNGVIKVQGTYQQRMCKILDKMKEHGTIKDWSYSPDRIQYIAQDNEKHIYIPDFKVFNTDGTSKYIETKGWLKWRDQYKLSGVRLLGYQIQMLFQEDIKSYEQKYM